MRKLTDLQKFRSMPVGMALALPGVQRVVRLELNTPMPCQVSIKDGDDADAPALFLANVEGRDGVEFVAQGNVVVHFASEAPIWYWTAELETSSVKLDALPFTKIATRKPRNLELERVAAKMQENADRRMAQMQKEMEKLHGTIAQLAETAKRPAKDAKARKADKPEKPQEEVEETETENSEELA